MLVTPPPIARVPLGQETVAVFGACHTDESTTVSGVRIHCDGDVPVRHIAYAVSSSSSSATLFTLVSQLRADSGPLPWT